MKKIFIILSILLLSASATAENSCSGKLTYGYEKDSMAYSVDLDDLEIREYGNDYLAFSIAIIRGILRKRGCSKSDINFKRTPLGRYSRSLCKLVVPGVDMSRVCYVESSLGYFNVSWDMLTSTHVIYNRWD